MTMYEASVLAIADVPSPPFTSLIPLARRLYAAAHSAWKQQEEQRAKGAVDRITRRLPRHVEVVRGRSSSRGFAGTIGEHAMGWAAHVLVIAAPMPMSWSWSGQRSVQVRLLRHGIGAVLAIPEAPATPRRGGRLLRLPRAISSGIRPASTAWTA